MLVKFVKGKRKKETDMLHYVGVIKEPIKAGFDVEFLKRKSGSIFIWPETSDCSKVKNHESIKVLEQPVINIIARPITTTFSEKFDGILCLY